MKKLVLAAAFSLIPVTLFAASIVVNPVFHVDDDDGNPLAGGCVYTYDCGGSTKHATCADVTCSSDNTNPIELNSRGEADIYTDQCIKIKVYTADADGVCDATPTTTLVDEKDLLYGTGGMPPADGISLSSTYSNDIASAITAIGATETTLVCDAAFTVASGTTVTLPTTLTWEPRPGCTANGVSGGGTETLVISKSLSRDIEWVGSDLTLSIDGTVYSSNFNDADLGARINRAISSVTDGNSVIVTGDEWFDTSFETQIEMADNTVNLFMPGPGDGTATSRAHYTGDGAAIVLSRSRSKIYGGFGIDFAGNSNETVYGINMAGSHCIINDDVEIYSVPDTAIYFGDDTASVYGNIFTGNVRISAPGKEGIRFAKDANRNLLGNVAISGSSTVFSAETVTLTQTGGLATATDADNTLAVGDVILVAGADQTDYNGVAIVKSHAGTTYTFYIPNDSAVSPATGTITVTRLNAGINFVDGYDNVISNYYDQNGAVGAIGIASMDSGGNTFGSAFFDSALDYSIVVDGGFIQTNGGKNNTSNTPKELNGGKVSIVNGGFNQPSLLNPRLIRPQNYQGAYQGSANPSIYATDGTGAAYPYDDSRNIILETGTGNDIVVVTGADGEWRWRISSGGVMRLRTTGTGNGVPIYECAGTPEGQIIAPVGSMALRNDGGANTTLYIKESGVGNTGWAAK